MRSHAVSHEIRADRTQLFLLPPSLDEWVASDHPARFVVDLVDSLDLVALGFRQSPGEEGRPHYGASMLLAVWLYGWMDRVRSTRALEKACVRDMAYLWITGNEHPDHNTLWRFFRDNKKPLQQLFKKTVQVAVKAGLVGYALHALDGTKMQAACSTDTALHRRRLDEKLVELDALIAASLREIERAQSHLEASFQMPRALTDAQKRREEIKKALAQLDAHQTEHLHPGEPDARMMRMRGRGPTLGYNAQIVVDHDSDLIVSTEVSADETDHAQLAPRLKQVLEEHGRVADETVADAGYSNGEQLAEAERHHLPVVVAFQERAGQDEPYAKSRFTYDAKRDVYTCPRGEVLPYASTARPSKSKPIGGRLYRCTNRGCPVRDDCSDNKNGRRIWRYDNEDAVVRQTERQDSAAKRILLSLRKEIVEHVFGLVKSNDAFRRFTVRGLEGARAQWSLACAALNLRKLCGEWVHGRLALGA